MRTGVRLYANVFDVPKEAAGELDRLYAFDEFKYENGDLDLEYEGAPVDIEEFVQTLTELVGPGARGKVDYINNDTWEITRYEIENGRVHARHMNINDVTDFLNPER